MWKLHCVFGAGLCCSSIHFAPTGKWFSAGYWQEQVKQHPYSSSVFVLWHHGVYPAPQRHDSLLWAVAQSHGGGQSMAPCWHPHCCPLSSLSERKPESSFGWHSIWIMRLQKAMGILWFLFLVFSSLTLFSFHSPNSQSWRFHQWTE